MMRLSVRYLVFVVLLLSISMTANAAKLKPYSLALKTNGDMMAVAAGVEAKLKKAGFQIIGTYQPYRAARIYAITSDELKQRAARTEYGGFGAIIKVAVTEVTTKQGGREVQVSYNNPNYVALAYNMKTSMQDIKDQLKKVIGFVQDFGGGEGIEEKHLPDYNYTFGLEGFYGFFELVNHGSYQKALREVEKGLATNKFGIGQVYKLKIPGKQQTIYGLSLQANVGKQPFLNDQFVMEVIDYQQPRRTPHLPYEIMVDGGKVIAMHPHFRLAVNFPDLHMFGEHSFGKLMDLPYVYEEFFTQAVGGKWPPGQEW